MQGQHVASSESDADAAARDLLVVADALVSSVCRQGYDTPVVDAEALKTMKTPSVRRAAAHADEILVMTVKRGSERFEQCAALADPRGAGRGRIIICVERTTRW